MRKTTLFGYNMERRSNRRRFVSLVYAALAALLAAGWFLDRLHTSGVYVYFAAYCISYFGLGGQGTYGLIKPFTGKGPRNRPMPTNLIDLELSMAGTLPAPEPSQFRNDERELQQRDRAHYRAYQALFFLLAPLWLLAAWTPHLVALATFAHIALLLTTATIVLALTLPQAILLWTEPDLVREPSESSNPVLTSYP